MLIQNKSLAHNSNIADNFNIPTITFTPKKKKIIVVSLTKSFLFFTLGLEGLKVLRIKLQPQQIFYSVYYFIQCIILLRISRTLHKQICKSFCRLIINGNLLLLTRSIHYSLYSCCMSVSSAQQITAKLTDKCI